MPVDGTETEEVVPGATGVHVSRIFGNRRVISLAGLGFSSGLPLLLTAATLQTWMTNAGLDLTTIGLFSAVAIPYSFKFAWAPLLDRFRLPFLGRRRGWLLATQLALGVGIAALGAIGPGAPVRLAIAALIVAFLSATQDVVADAYRSDTLRPEERAAGAATFVLGYRIAMLLAGAFALVLSDIIVWPAVYVLLGGVMVACSLVTWFAPEPPPIEAPATLAEAVVRPFLSYFRRRGALLALVVLVLYRLGDAFAEAMISPFLVKTGFTNSQIGAWNQGLGLAATISGALLSGGLVARLGMKRSLLAFGAFQAATNVLYLALALVGKNLPLLVLAIGVDNLAKGLGTAAFVAFLMSLCEARFSATQYALLSSLGTFGARTLAAGSGTLAKNLGWPAFFGFTIALAIPGLLAMALLPRCVWTDARD